MGKFQLLLSKLSNYPPEVRTAILKGLLKAAKKKLIDSKEKIQLEKLNQNDVTEDCFKTEYGILYFNEGQKNDDI